MLVLTRRVDQSIAIGDHITVTVLAVDGEQVKLGISAPQDVLILRQEIFQAVKDQSNIQQRLATDPEPKSFQQLRDLLNDESPPEEGG